jgi:hypothetical protein
MVQSTGSSYTPKKKTTPKTSSYSSGSAIDRANEAAFEREQEIRALFDEIIGTYAPGGSFGAGTEAMINRQKSQDLAKSTQSLISSGLYGSTMTAGLGTAWEESVGMPSRMKLEDLRTQRYTDALTGKAGFIEGIQDESPSFETIANLTAQASSAPEPSLSDWLGQTFGGTPNAATPKANASKAAQRAESEAWRKQQAANYAKLLEQYGSVGRG